MMVFNRKLKCRARLAKQAAVTLGYENGYKTKQGLSEALKFAPGNESKAIVRKPARDETNELIETDLEHNSGSIEPTK